MKIVRRLLRSFEGSGESKWIELGLAVAAMSAYVLAFIPPFTPEEYRIAELAATPVVVFAWLFGFWGGTAAAVIIIPFNAFLFSLVAEETFGTVMSQMQHEELLPSVLLLVLGAVLGGLRDVADQTRRELLLRTEMEAAQRESEEAYRFVAETASDGILTIDGDRTILFANRAAEKIFGSSITDLVGRPFRTLIPERVRDDHDAALKQYLETVVTSSPDYALQIAGLGKGDREIALEISFGEYVKDGRHAFTGVVRDVSERQQIVHVLNRAREDAERAVRAKSEFLSRMTRELRTPLNGVLGFAQLLELDELDPARQESVAQILTRVRHLLSFIDEVRELGRLEAGRLPLSLEPVPVAEVAAEAWQVVRHRAEQSGIRLVDGGGACDAVVTADRQRLNEVMLHLLSTAVQYNVENGTVEVTCGPGATAEERLRVAVTDTGRGIPEGSVERLFIPFERLGAEQAGMDNTGIGLAVSRGLIEAMGGEIGAESIEGQGSTFWFELPLDGATPAGEPEAGGATAGVGSAVPGSPDPERQRTILHIDDGPSGPEAVAEILSGRPGLEILTAGRGQEGLVLARNSDPDLILLDLNLPDMHGSELMRRIREDPAVSRTPVIILGADLPPDQAAQLLEAGAQACLSKPLDGHDLVRIIEAVLDS